MAGLEEETEGVEEPAVAHGHGSHGHGYGNGKHAAGHHHHGGKKPAKKPHQHASLGFESIGLEIGDGPLDWGLLENWLYDQVGGGIR